MTKKRQKLLLLAPERMSPNSPILAWSLFDGTGAQQFVPGQEEEPPYPSVQAALMDGWRVIQLPIQIPPWPGQEERTSYLGYFALERIEEVDG